MKDQKGNPNQIKPNELRIGNIISYSDGTHHTVSKFDDYKVWFEKVANQHGVKCWIVSNIEDVAPTPLTEELLLKCGFELRIDSPLRTSYTRYEPYAEYTFPKTNTTYKLGLLFGGRHFDILYLHQLQNLFYAITGEELEINL